MSRKYAGGDLHATHPGTGAPVTIKIRWTSHLPSDDPQTITVLNTINRKWVYSALHSPITCSAMVAQNYQQFNRHFFDPSRSAEVPALGLTIWPGIVSAIRPYDAGLLMSVNVAHKVIRKDTVYDVLLNAYSTYNCTGDFNEQAKQQANSALIGQTVLTM